MTRTHSLYLKHLGTTLRLAVLIGVLAGCTGPISVRTRAHDEASLSDYGTFRLSVAEAEAEAEAEGADGDRDEIPLALLEREATALVRERGYGAGAGEAAEVAIRLTAASERVTRRTWSADPGYNGYVEREREEGVLTLVAVDPARDVEVWRGESRVRLPEAGFVVGPSREAVWMDALVELISRLPAREGR